MRHDLVLIDPRGTGRSGAINCPDLQNGFRNYPAFQTAVESCGRQLGAAADRYGSGDVALDVEDVRKALGYDQIDYYGFSYGPVPEQGYAARFPQHVHALDAGLVASDGGQFFYWGLACRRGSCGSSVFCAGAARPATAMWRRPSVTSQAVCEHIP